ncbi:hypothetical protein ACTXT7_012542 [Hymenolepis weldensis]
MGRAGDALVAPPNNAQLRFAACVMSTTRSHLATLHCACAELVYHSTTDYFIPGTTDNTQDTQHTATTTTKHQDHCRTHFVQATRQSGLTPGTHSQQKSGPSHLTPASRRPRRAYTTCKLKLYLGRTERLWYTSLRAMEIAYPLVVGQSNILDHFECEIITVPSMDPEW